MQLSFAGSDQAAREKFACYFALDPIEASGGMRPYITMNDEYDGAGKDFPEYRYRLSSALRTLPSKAVIEARQLLMDYAISHPEQPTRIYFECYGQKKLREVPEESTAYSWRQRGYQA